MAALIARRAAIAQQIAMIMLACGACLLGLLRAYPGAATSTWQPASGTVHQAEAPAAAPAAPAVATESQPAIPRSSTPATAAAVASRPEEEGEGVPMRGDPRAVAVSRKVDHSAMAAAAGATAAAQLATLVQQADGGQADPAAPGALPNLPFPHVALLFLTRGPMPFIRLWDEWMGSVDGLVPSYGAAALGCGQEAVERVRRVGGAATGPRGQPLPLYLRQHLFSVYVHAPAQFKQRYERGSIFYGRKTKARLTTRWGTHSLVAAARLLLQEALQDPRNQRFLLLSESDVPLWPAGLLYLQMMGEPKSSLNACAPSTQQEVADSQPHTARLLGIPATAWRKSSQWISLTREHARLVAEDREVEPVFAQKCYVKWDFRHWRPLGPDGRWCVSDEHYVPTLLAMRGEEANCTCSQPGGRGTPTHTQWPGGPHPRTFYARELTRDGIQGLRSCDNASATAALRGYRDLLPHATNWSQQACSKAAAELAQAGVHVAAASGSAAAGGNGTAGQPLPLLPQYACYLALRKVDPAAGPLLAQAVQQGLLEGQLASGAGWPG
ncbi:hypothetical protein ABPG75_010381 [Micractinium tetrahymenae]